MPNKIKKHKKIIVAVAFIIALVLLGKIAIRLLTPYTYTIETSFGDTFMIFFDPFFAETTIQEQSKYSSFCLVLDGKFTKDDLIGLYNSDGIKVYRFGKVAFYDEGNGFEKFLVSTCDNEDVISVVKSNLLSNYLFFLYYIEDFWNSDKYHEEMRYVSRMIVDKNYSELSEYGLTEEIINDDDEMDKFCNLAKGYRWHSIKANLMVQ